MYEEVAIVIDLKIFIFNGCLLEFVSGARDRHIL